MKFVLFIICLFTASLQAVEHEKVFVTTHIDDNLERQGNPTALNLPKNSDHLIIIEKEGYDKICIPVIRRGNPSRMALAALPGGLLFCTFDRLSGSYYTFKNTKVFARIRQIEAKDLFFELFLHQCNLPKKLAQFKQHR